MSKNEEYLYKTSAVNEDGVNGYSYVDRPDGLRVVVSSPLNDEPGTNPEELLGLALSTCFNATIQSILKEYRMSNKSKVEIPVELRKEKAEPGYYFDVEVHAAIEGLSVDDAKEIIEISSKRCPVFKLVKASHTVHLKTVKYE